MAVNTEPSEAVGADELHKLEASVLEALCLTINTAGSELKYDILEKLAEDDFYFPLHKALFRTLAELHGRGEYVIAANLDEELRKCATTLPTGFAIEEFFSGTIPSSTDLDRWIARVKERSHRDPPAERATSSIGDTAVTDAFTGPWDSAVEIPVDLSALEDVARKGGAISESASETNVSVSLDLTSEGCEWLDFMDVLGSKQGKTFVTGFTRLDAGLGCIRPGLMVVVDDEPQRRASFLKQMADQAAALGEVRCLYFASELPKGALRLRTLARLSGVPATDIEQGWLKKDSEEWARVDREGRAALGWLERVFVYEVHAPLRVVAAAELIHRLVSLGRRGVVLWS